MQCSLKPSKNFLRLRRAVIGFSLTASKCYTIWEHDPYIGDIIISFLCLSKPEFNSISKTN